MAGHHIQPLGIGGGLLTGKKILGQQVAALLGQRQAAAGVRQLLMVLVRFEQVPSLGEAGVEQGLAGGVELRRGGQCCHKLPEKQN